MMKAALAAATVLVATTVAFAGPGKRHGGGHFKHADKDGNGELSREEFRGPEEAFDKIDADGNGSLTKDELKAGRKAMRGQAGKRFKESDTDGNGELSREEFQGPEEAFDKIDADGNGSLTRKELRAAHKGRKARKGKCDQKPAGDQETI